MMCTEDIFLEIAKRCPTCICLCRLLDSIGEIHKEIKSGPLFDLIDRHSVVCVTVAIGLMLEPEAYRTC